MAVDTPPADLENVPPAEDEDDGDEWKVYKVRVHKSVHDAYDVPTALQMLAGDEQTYGKLHFNFKPSRQPEPSEKRPNPKPTTNMVTIDTVEKRSAAAGVDAEAQKFAARAIRAALKDPKTGAALQAVLRKQAAGQTVTKDEILGALDLETLATVMSALKPTDGRGRPKANATPAS